jgi:hypothetical protein
MKQAWYRCAELIEKPGSVREINEKYKITLDDDAVSLAAVPDDWLEGVEIPNDVSNAGATPRTGWHLEEMRKYFDEHGVVFFETLNIWHIPELRMEFFRRTGRMPRGRVQSKLTGYLSRIGAAVRRLAG